MNLAAGAELIVPGEGELVLEQVLQGVANPTTDQITDLDTLPWPDRERINIDQ